jgi:hypothetical protein
MLSTDIDTFADPHRDQIQGIIVSKFEYFHPPQVPLHKEGGHQTGFPGSPPTHQHREATLGTLIKRCAIFSSASIITDGLHTTTCGPSLNLNVQFESFEKGMVERLEVDVAGL